MIQRAMNTGALYTDGVCRFSLWAPGVGKPELEVLTPVSRRIQLEHTGHGFWRTEAELDPGSRYMYDLPGAGKRPDPCSFFQPEGVHGPSAVVDHGGFRWTDGKWRGIPLEQMIMYELHIGTFTQEGTFRAVIPRLGELAELGVNTLELMPVAQFPGERNWGYDGVFPYAVQNSYGGPRGLKELVDACHGHGMAVILDVIYNHLGPEGNYLRDFGPYFTDRYRTPWGEAVNFDGPGSDPVRAYFIGNALHWLQRYHIDGLRLDAVHAIYDFGAHHFLQELAEAVDALSRSEGRKRLLIAESDLNDVRIIRPGSIGGYGLDGQWNEDFHHALHTLLTGEHESYYRDFGRLDHFESVLRRNFHYGWRPSVYRGKRFGSPRPEDREPSQFVVYSQNHDQVGNRLEGDRLSTLVGPDALKLAAAAVLLSPFVPMLFMGEEYAETSPFQYFIDHGDPELVRATREGRKREFAAFGWQEEPPDPADPETFKRSRLRWEERLRGVHGKMLAWYRELIRLRSTLSSLRQTDCRFSDITAIEHKKLAAVQRRTAGSGEAVEQALIVLHFGGGEVRWETRFPGPVPDGAWRRVLDSADEAWGGSGLLLPEHLEEGVELPVGPYQAVLYLHEPASG
jgi:maltooligosyltrehalose trehalohydrolase